MYKIAGILVLLFTTTALFGQSNRDFRSNKRSKMFGKRDFNYYRPYGIQLSFGATYTMTRLNNELIKPDSAVVGSRYQYELDPIGGLGAFLEIGMAHFPTGDPKFRIGQKRFRLVSYYDWGLGVKTFSGKEELRIDNLDSQDNVVSSDYSTAKMMEIRGYGHITAHKNFYFKEGNFLDNGLGLNFDYTVVNDQKNHPEAMIKADQRFSKAFAAQLHYELGYGIKLRRGAYLIPGVHAPILGISEWNGGNPSILWFSSKYWPIQAKIKFIWLFKEKSKGCNTGSEEDQKRNREYMQNR